MLNTIINNKFLKALQLLLTIILTYIVFSNISYDEVISSIAWSKINYLIYGYMITAFIPFFTAYQFKIFTDSSSIPLAFKEILKVDLIKSFYEFVIPVSVVGPVIKYYKLSNLVENDSGILGFMALTKLINIIAFIITAIIFWIFCRDDNRIINYLVLLMGIALILILGICIILKLKERTILAFISGKTNSNNTYVIKVCEKLLKITDSYKNINKKTLFYVLLINILRNLVGIYSIYILMLALGINFPFLKLVVVRTITFFITSIPLTFGGLGIREGSFLVLFEHYSIDTAKIVALSYLIFLRIVMLNMIGGLLELRDLMKDKSIMARIW